MKKTIFLAIAHLFTDFITVFALFSGLNSASFSLEQCVQITLLYNIVAFALQLPVGLLADKIRNPKLILIVSGILIGAGLTLFHLSVYPMVIIMGLGNAFFHIGGGIETLQIAPEKSKYIGLFVGPGAVGLTLGTILGRKGFFHPFFLFIPIALLILFFLLMPGTTKQKKRSETPSFQLKVSFPFLFTILIFGAIFFRVVIGVVSKYDYPPGMLSIILITSAVLLGKSLGGFIADRFGRDKTILVSLVLSGFLIAFKSGNIYLYAGGLLCFQMIMSVTLTGLNGILKNKSGLAFGLNCLAYFFGVVMKKSSLIYKMRDPLIILFMILGVAVIMFLIFRNITLLNKEKFRKEYI